MGGLGGGGGVGHAKKSLQRKGQPKKYGLYGGGGGGGGEVTQNNYP